MTKTFVVRAMLLTSASLIHAIPAYAQEAAGSLPATQSESTVGIEDIVVTAQRRDQRLQDVPISVTAISSDTLARANISSSSDLPAVTPGLQISTQLTSATVSLRGVGTSDISAGNENAVPIYVDGVYIPSMAAGIFSLLNIERIEVLKGPQGTLFGRNASGGLIQVITRDPTQKLEAEARLGYGNYQTFEASGYLAGGLSDKLAAALAVHYSHQGEGWGRNLLTGAQANRVKSDLSLQTKWVYESGETKITLAGDYSDRVSDIGTTFQILPGTVALGGTPFQGSIYDTVRGLPEGGYTRTGGGSIKIEQGLSFGRLISISSYRKLKSFIPIDQDATPQVITDATLAARDRDFTQEIQLASNRDSAIQWIIGAFYMARTSQYDPFIVRSDLFFPPFFGGQVQNFTRQNTRSISGFGQATVPIFAKTNVTLGIRYTSDRQEFHGQQLTGTGIDLGSAADKTTFNKITYRVAVDHHFNNNLMAYASYNRGFKSGLYNLTSATVSLAKPETLDAYEAGLKSDLFGGRVRINGSFFYYDYRDLQVQKLVGGIAFTQNADAELYGFDLTTNFALSSRLRLDLGWNYLPRAKYTNYPNTIVTSPATVPPGGNDVVDGVNVAGARLIRAPRNTVNLGVSYTAPVAGGDLNLSTNIYRNDGSFWAPDNRVESPTYTLVNAQVAWTSSNSPFELRVWARNLANEKYYSVVGETNLGDSFVPGAPRTYGASIGFKF